MADQVISERARVNKNCTHLTDDSDMRNASGLLFTDKFRSEVHTVTIVVLYEVYVK